MSNAAFLEARAFDRTSHQNPPSLPSTIKVKHSSNSHVSSSVPGLSSYLDMSMTKISPDNHVTMVRKCVQKHMFLIWKFYHKEYHAHYSQDERTMCGFLLKNANLRGNHNWWLEMQRVVIKTHMDVLISAIETCKPGVHVSHHLLARGLTSNLEHVIFASGM